MRKLLLLCYFLLLINIAKAQQKAVTETGKEVILFDNGTWKYQDESDIEEKEIPRNPKKFKKSKDATFLLKSTTFKVGFWLNPKKWSFTKDGSNAEAEYELKLKGEDVYAMILTEKIEIPLETLKIIALENAKSVAPDMKVIKEEYRTVNGIEILLIEMKGTLQGIKIAYYGYYFSNPNGTVQFMTFTSQNLIDGYKAECEELLNGLVELK